MERSLLAVAPVADPGGAETTLLRLLGGLEERGWRVTLSTPAPGPPRAPRIPAPRAVDGPWPAGDGPLIGYVGRIEPRKGARDLVQAAPAIHAGAPAARIVLVGEDEHGVDRRYRDAVVADTETEHYGSIEGVA